MKKVPKGWGSGHLNNLVERLDSGTSIICQDTPPTDGEAAILKLNCVSGGRFDPSAAKRVNEKDVGRLSVFARAGRVIISRSNTPLLVGVCAFVPKDYPRLFLPDTLWQLEFRADAKIDARWLTYLLQSKPYRKLLGSIASGTSGSMKKLQKPSLLRIPIPIPPIAEQKKIGSIFETLNFEVETITTLIANKLERKRGLLQQLLTGQTRFKEFKGERWQKLPAGTLFQNRSQRNDCGAPVLSVTQDQGIVLRDSLDRRISADEENHPNYKLVLPGDFVISLRSFQGGLEYSPLNGAVSPAYHVITPKIEISSDFYRHYFKSYEFIARLAVTVIGIRDGKQISLGDFEFLKLPYPPVSEQKRIAAVLNTCDEEIKLLEKQLEALKEQKRGLMQKLLTGEVRVKI